MSIAQTTFANITNAINQLGLLAVDIDEATEVVQHIGIQPLQGLFSAARSGDSEAKVRIHQAILSAKASAYMIKTGKSAAVMAVACKMVDANGYPKIRELMVKSAEGDANASTILDQLIERATGGAGGGQEPVDQLAQPLHETDVAPPTGHQPVQQPQNNQREQRAPAQRQQAQVYRADGEAAARTPATRQQHSNVSQMPSRTQSNDFDAEPSSRDYAPSDGSNAGGRNGNDQQNQGHAQGNGQGNGHQNQRQYDQHSCYGKDIAATFERTPNLQRTNNTVNLKVAKAKFQGKTCKEGVDWQGAIIIMMEPHEVQIAYAVLMGFGPKCRFAGHGRDNQKWFELEETSGEYAGAIRLTVAHGREDVRRINISHTDAKEVLEVFSRTLQDQGKGQSPVFMMAEVRRVYDLYTKRTEATAARGQGQRQGQTSR